MACALTGVDLFVVSCDFINFKHIIMNVNTTIFRTAEDWSKQFFEGALSYDEQKEILIKSGLMIFDHKKNGATAKGSWFNRTDGLFPPFLAGR